VASLITSRHQKEAQTTIEVRPKTIIQPPLVKKCIYNAKPEKVKKTLSAVKMGHGLESTT